MWCVRRLTSLSTVSYPPSRVRDKVMQDEVVVPNKNNGITQVYPSKTVVVNKRNNEMSTSLSKPRLYNLKEFVQGIAFIFAN